MHDARNAQADIDHIKTAIFEAFDERARIDAKTHGEHHAFIERWIERERMREERWETVKTQLIGWGLVSAIGAIGAWVVAHWGVRVGD